MPNRRNTLLMWLPLLGGAMTALADAPAWELNAAQRAMIATGQIVVVGDRDSKGAAGRAAVIQAAVRIQAPRETVFQIMTDCAAAAAWVPHLVRCEVVERDPAGSWEVIAHRVDYGWYAPRVEYVFRARYENRSRIIFEHVSGDFDQNEGMWALETVEDGAATLLTYRVRSQPKMYVPSWLYQRSVESELPALLRALRTRAQR